MSEVKWEEERAQLLNQLKEALQIAAESKSEAAVYREMLEDWYEVAEKARSQKELSILEKISNRGLIPFYLPDKEEVKLWGKYFLHAYIRDAGWLEDTLKALEQIKADTEKILQENEISAELRMKIKRIHEIAEEGLITHI